MVQLSYQNKRCIVVFLVGNFQHALDDKNRIRLPAKHREVLGNNYILMPGLNGCITVYSADQEQKLLDIIKDLDSFDPERAEWIRSIAEFSATAEADSQGRFMLPQDLLEIAGIKKNVRIVGAISKVEIWSEEAYIARRENQDRSASAFDNLYRNLHKTMENK